MIINLFKKGDFHGLGVTVWEDKPTIFFQSKASDKICIAQSTDGQDFELTPDKLTILNSDSKEIYAHEISDLKISPIFKSHIMFAKTNSAEHPQTITAFSDDLLNWDIKTTLPENVSSGLNVENFIFRDKHVFYFGGNRLKVGLTDTGLNWQILDEEAEIADNFTVDYVLRTNQGIFLLYHHYSNMEGGNLLEVKAACFDKINPTKIIWHTKSSLWQEPADWKQKNSTCLGCIYFEGRLLSYWDVPGVGIYLVTYPMFMETPTHENNHYKFNKHIENPILTPNPNHIWENEATFNPAAFYDGEKIYLIYRAVGYGYISVLGYAESYDGVHFEKRRHQPIFTGNHPFDSKSPNATFDTARQYLSGGSYGGIEDPRVTKIDDKLYVIYVAFNGFDPPRLALTSILYDDFINERFLWEKPVLISPPGVVDKSGCVLPEKINGKYVIFHRIFPNILIDFVDDLNFDGTKYLKGEFKITPRPTMWDSRKVGIGAPPIKTAEGWLLIYQGVTDKDDSKYRIGAMLLDLNDPTKVLYRTNHPIIEPTEFYENGLAKFGVVYPCGAVIKDGKLLVYYGGSDSVTCLATADLVEFLKEIKEGSNARLTPINLN